MTYSHPQRVFIHEVGPREGVQSEAQIPTEAKIRLANALSETGLQSIELVSFVSPKWVPAMADAEEVLARINRKPGVRYTGIYLNVQGLERALAAHCVVDGTLTVSASDAFQKRNTNKSLDEAFAALPEYIVAYQAAGIAVDEAFVAAAFGCNFEGTISIERVMECISRIIAIAGEHGERITKVKLLDTMGWANPDQIHRVLDRVRSTWPELIVALHLHDTRGLGLANADAALREGVSHFDAAVAGLGGCPFAAVKGAPGNITTEDFVFLCEEMGIETGVNLEKLVECAVLAEEIFGRSLPGHLSKGGLFRNIRPQSWAHSFA